MTHTIWKSIDLLDLQGHLSSRVIGKFMLTDATGNCPWPRGSQY